MIFDFLFRFLFSRRAGAVIRRISWLTWGGLTVSVAALILVLSVMRDLNHRIEVRTLAAEPHLWVEVPGLSSAQLDLHPIVQKIRDKKDWQMTSEETQDVILRTMDGRFQGAIARGMTQNGLTTLLQLIEKAKSSTRDKKNPNIESLQTFDSELHTSEIILGSDLAHSLGVYEGDLLMVLPPESLLLPSGEAPAFERVRIKQLLTTNLADIDGKNIFYLKGEALRSFSGSPSRKQGFVVWTDNAKKVANYKEDLEQLSGVHVETWMERNSALFMALKLEKAVITLFLALASLVAGFSLISVMALLVSQKRKEMGLLQAIGLGPLALKKLLTGIGVGLGGLGLLSGGFLGASLSLYLESYPLKVLPDIYYDSEISALTDWNLILVVMVIGFLLSYFGSKAVGVGLYSQSPSELLRSQART